MHRGSWDAGLFFPFGWAVALAEETDMTVHAAQEIRAIDQECLDVFLGPSQDVPAQVIPFKQREQFNRGAPAEPKRRYG